MHRAAVVPHHEVANAPTVGVDELSLRGVLDEVFEEAHRFSCWPADDPTRMRGQEERLAASRRMDTNQALANRLEAFSFGLGEVGEAELQAGVDLRVFADQILLIALSAKPYMKGAR